MSKSKCETAVYSRFCYLVTKAKFLGLTNKLGFSELRASHVAQLVKNLPGFDPWVGKIPWRRERLPTPVFWPGEFHGLSPWGRKELDMTE